MTITTHSIEQVERIVCEFLKVSPEQIRKRHNGERSWNKHLLIYCLYKFTDATVNSIRHFVGVDHSAVSKSTNVVNDICSVYEEKRNQVIELESLFE